jgi:hypothetical protein
VSDPCPANSTQASGERSAAITFHEQALAIHRETGDRRSEAITAWNLGHAYAQQGDVARGLELMQLTVDYEYSVGHPNAEKDAQLLEGLRHRAGGQAGAE